jgi:hypothetical protein
MIKKQRLELTWIGKDNRGRRQPRLRLEEAGLPPALALNC